MEKRIQELTEQVQKLQNKLKEQAQAKRLGTSKKRRELEQRVVDMQNFIKKEERDNLEQVQFLKSSEKKFRERAKTLTVERDQIKSEYDELRKVIDGLTETKTNVVRKYETLEEKVEDLKKRLAREKYDNLYFKRKNKALEDEIGDIKSNRFAEFRKLSFWKRIKLLFL
jgi:chromosome segregation ATPase